MTGLGRIVVFVVACLFVFLGAVQAASPRYGLTQLHAVATAAGTYASAYDLNDRGEVAGSESAYRNGMIGQPDITRTRPIVWNAAGIGTALPNVANMGGEAIALNNNGLVVGTSYSTTGTFPPGRATIFRASGSTLIPVQQASNSSTAVSTLR